MRAPKLQCCAEHTRAQTRVLAPCLDCYPGFGPAARGSVRKCLDDEASDERLYEGWGHNPCRGPACLLLFFSRFLATTLPRQCFLCPLFFAGLQVKGVTFHFLNDVFLLHLALEATQSVFERFAFLQSDFSQRNYTPKPVLLDLLVIASPPRKVKHYIEFLPSFLRTRSTRNRGEARAATAVVQRRSWPA